MLHLACPHPRGFPTGITRELHTEDILELPWVSEFAHGRPIDLSIQFTLWWTPFLVLLGWWTERPMHLLFGTSFTFEGPKLSSMEGPS